MPQSQQSAAGSGSDPAWHQALAYAVTGRRIAELGRQARPDLAWLTDYLSRLTSGEDLEATAADPPPDGRVPADLMAGIGAAQFGAALARTPLRTRPGRAPSGAAGGRGSALVG